MPIIEKSSVVMRFYN